MGCVCVADLLHIIVGEVLVVCRLVQCIRHRLQAAGRVLVRVGYGRIVSKDLASDTTLQVAVECGCLVLRICDAVQRAAGAPVKECCPVLRVGGRIHLAIGIVVPSGPQPAAILALGQVENGCQSLAKIL